jgi:hypothetical protein
MYMISALLARLGTRLGAWREHARVGRGVWAVAGVLMALGYVVLAGYTHVQAMLFMRRFGLAAPGLTSSAILGSVIAEQFFSLMSCLILAAFLLFLLRVKVAQARLGYPELLAMSVLPFLVWALAARGLTTWWLEHLSAYAIQRSYPRQLVGASLVQLSQLLIVGRLIAVVAAIGAVAWLVRRVENVRWQTAFMVSGLAVAARLIVGRVFTLLA